MREKTQLKLTTLLITNDDGYQAPGINALRRSLLDSYSVYVLAPDRERSAIGHGIKVFEPVFIKEIEQDFHIINGTPADCTRTALAGFFNQPIDLVVSGINYGPNLGWDVYYSGTVAGAREAAMKGIMGIAISLDTWTTEQQLGTSSIPSNMVYWESATYYLKQILKLLEQIDLPKGVYLNINIPNIPKDEIKGIMATKIGFRYYKEKITLVESHDHWREVKFNWMPTIELVDGTDSWAVNNKYISITPISLDATDKVALELIERLNEMMKSQG